MFVGFGNYFSQDLRWREPYGNANTGLVATGVTYCGAYVGEVRDGDTLHVEEGFIYGIVNGRGDVSPEDRMHVLADLAV
jgi:hypothetical protein